MSRKNSRTRILDAALTLITKRGEAGVTMAEIAKAARVSRQAVYLNFADRGDLLIALVRYVDEKRGLAQEIQKIANAPTGLEALRVMVSVQVRMNPGVWAIARAMDAVRRTDQAVERSWLDRLNSRLEGCRAIVARLARDGVLRKELPASAAADILWSVTSLRTWEDLVLQRGWTAAQYEERIYKLLLSTLTSK
ncbi:MAG TPA: TetR/AcrR family transcriptional regulator [Bryobacteraceae bacterium]|nr:TetR/AcrR family transcriptional regulator [Bryobacteraceae bacterium]